MKSAITKPHGVQDKETKYIVPGDLMFHRGLYEFWLVVAIKSKGLVKQLPHEWGPGVVMYDVDFLTSDPVTITRLQLGANSQLAIIEAPNRTQ